MMPFLPTEPVRGPIPPSDPASHLEGNLNRYLSTLAVPEAAGPAPAQAGLRAAVNALPGIGAAFRRLTGGGRGGGAALSVQRVADLRRIAAAFGHRTPAFVDAKLDRYLRGAALDAVLADTDLQEHVQDLAAPPDRLARDRTDAAGTVQRVLDDARNSRVRIVMQAGAAQGIVGALDLDRCGADAYRPGAVHAWTVLRQAEAGGCAYDVTDNGNLGFRWRLPAAADGRGAWRWTEVGPGGTARLPAGAILQLPDAALPAESHVVRRPDGPAVRRPGYLGAFLQVVLPLPGAAVAPHARGVAPGIACGAVQPSLQLRTSPGALAVAGPPEPFAVAEVMDGAAQYARLLAQLPAGTRPGASRPAA